MRPRVSSSLAGSPLLVGAVTLLVAIVGVYLAYNANAGLPFVPTYDLRAELPTGAKLVRGNDVRIGGFRVGTVARIEGVERTVEGRRRAVALVDLELDEDVRPLAADSTLRVRPRSALGIKFVEITPGRSDRELSPGDTVPLAQASEPLEFEDVFGTFTDGTRTSLREAAEGLGDATAGRGRSINASLEALPGLLAHLTPVMRTLSDPGTDLDGLVRGLGATMAQLAPETQAAANLVTAAADTLDALARDPAALTATIERLAPTLAVGTRVLATTRPVVVDATTLVRALRPAAVELTRSLPPLERALAAGTPVLSRTVGLSEDLAGAATALRELVRDPNTLLSLRDLRNSLAVLRPTIEYVAPYQTVCNYGVYFFNALGEHQSQPAPGGNQQPQLARIVNYTQPNSMEFTISSRPWDLPPGQPAQGAMFDGQPAGRAFGPPYQPAIDAQGNADCQNGQVGYPNFSMLEDFTRRNHAGSDPSDPYDIVTGTLPDGTPAGGNAAVGLSDYPGLAGGTYKSRELGIDNLKDVP